MSFSGEKLNHISKVSSASPRFSIMNSRYTHSPVSPGSSKRFGIGVKQEDLNKNHSKLSIISSTIAAARDGSIFMGMCRNALFIPFFLA